MKRYSSLWLDKRLFLATEDTEDTEKRYFLTGSGLREKDLTAEDAKNAEA